jgi:hypothetical protein
MTRLFGTERCRNLHTDELIKPDYGGNMKESVTGAEDI